MRFRFLLACCSLALVASTALHAGDRPNILLIVSDDQGYNDLGLLGNGILTPHLDRLAQEGVRLTNFYVAWPACTPSRAALLSGRYPQRCGVYDMIRNEAPDYGHRYTPAEYEATFERIGGMDTREVLLPEMLKPSGYQSAIYGKWDLGSLRRFLPTSRGFDDFYGFVNTGIDYFTHERYGVPSMVRNMQPTTEDKGTYATHLFEREALRFLKTRDTTRPFFLYLPFNAPHNSSSLDPTIRSTIQAPEKYKRLYPPVANETREAKSYRYQYGDGPVRVATSEARQRDYRAAVTCMDAAIGRVLDLLEEQECLDDTIVIFFSDNGGGSGSDNTPLRGKKSQMWEGGIRVPCLIRWPSGKVPANTTSDAFLTSLDLVPSLLAATGTPPPEGVTLDGHDWWSCLKSDAPSPRRAMFWQRRDHKATRVGNWKWVDIPGAEGLFDLATDPGEQHDLSTERAEVLRRMRAAFAQWRTRMEATEPRGPFRDF